VADEGDVAARSLDVGLADRNDVITLGHLALQVVEHLPLEHDHRIVVANGALEETLGVGRRRGRHDLEAGDVRVPALERLGVLRPELQRRAPRPAEHDRHRELAARHVAHLGGGVDDLVDGQQGEVPGHHFDDRAEAHHGGSHADPGEAELGDRRVHHPPGAEFLEQAAAHLVGAVVFGDFLAHEEDPVIALHLLAERLAQRVAIGDHRHAERASGA
jgi:hypothetical protein